MFKRSTTTIVRGGLIRTALQQKQASAEDPEADRRNGEISAARKQLLLICGLCLVIVFLAAALLLTHLLPGPSEALPLGEGEGLLVLPAEQALLEAVAPGDLVQLHTAQGPLASARYVRVVSVGQDGLGLAMTELQIQDYLAAAEAGMVAVIPLTVPDGEAALAQQRQWNSPEISLTLSATALELEVGGSAVLVANATASPEGATLPGLRWSSSDPAVAMISEDGTLAAIEPGVTTLTALCGEETATCQVTVLRCATGLLFGADAYDLQAGETLALTLLTSPEEVFEPISWASSDEAVATVSEDGVVTAHGGGSAVITATGRYAGASVTVNVRVPVASVILNSTELSLTVGSTAQLAAVVMPENATDKTVLWASDNEAVATVDANGLVQALAPGSVTISATCGDASSTCAVTVAPATAPQP